MSAQPSLFDQRFDEAGEDVAQAPPPPTGPDRRPARDEGEPEAFLKFMDSEEGREFWTAIERAAVAALARREDSFSTRTFVALYRATHKLKINDHFSPWLADRLVARHPGLLDIIERRVRKKAGPSAGLVR